MRTWLAHHWLTAAMGLAAAVIVGVVVADPFVDSFQVEVGTLGDWVPGLALLLAVDELIRTRRQSRIEVVRSAFDRARQELGEHRAEMAPYIESAELLRGVPLELRADGTIDRHVGFAAASLGAKFHKRPRPKWLPLPMLHHEPAIRGLIEKLSETQAATMAVSPDWQPPDPPAVIDVMRELRNHFEAVERFAPDMEQKFVADAAALDAELSDLRARASRVS